MFNLDGKKTYIVAILAGLIGAYTGLDSMMNDQLPNIPDWIYTVLSGFGLWGVRSALAKMERKDQ